MTTIAFYTNPMSRGRIVRWMLEEVGAPYETHIITYGPLMKQADYLSINPMGKVPAIRHGDAVVTETAAICAYLADAFPDAGLAPPIDRRGGYYRWLFFAAGPFEAAVTNQSLQVQIPEERRGMVGYGSLELVLDTLEKAISAGEYIAGDHFSAADVYIGAQIGFGLQFGTIERRPVFEAYLARLLARPAWQKASALDDAALEALKAAG